MELSTTVPRSHVRLAGVLGHLDQLGAAAYGFLVVALVAGSAGGYSQTTWGWAALATLWLGAVVLLARERIELGALELVFAGGLALFGAWVALSNLWTPSVPSTMREVQRELAYIGVVATGLLVVRARSAPHLLGGVLCAVAALDVYALSIRILPDRLGGFDSISYDYRLAPPITYWNGLAIFTVVGVLLALGFATRGRSLITRTAAAAALPILVSTMYFTFSRGAWFALFIGLAAVIAIDPRRLQLIAVGIVLAPWPVLAIASARSQEGLVTIGSTVQQATADGHHFLRVLALLAVASGAVGLAAAVVERRVPVPRAVRLAFATVLVLVGVLGAARVWTTEGSPTTLAHRGWDAFHGAPHNRGANGDVSARLLSFSSNGRLSLWGVSFDRFEQAPVLGDGAGTYSQAWARFRDFPGDSQEGHSLYFEVLGELGAVGLGLLLLALSAPVVAAFRARHVALAPAALGAYLAWAAHAGVDWDWELLGVTIPALLCGVALIAARREVVSVRELGVRARIAGVVVLLALSVAVVPGLMSEISIASSYSALGDGRYAASLQQAHRASRWAPWASAPRRLVADIYASRGEKRRAADGYRDALRHDSSSWPLWQALASVTTGAERQAALAHARRLNPLAPI